MDSFIRYAEGRFSRDREEFAFRAYVTESIRLQGEDKRITVKWTDIVTPKPVENVDAAKVVARVISKARLVVMRNESDGPDC